MKQSGWRFFVKTAVDRAAGLVGLAVAAPVLAGAAVAVRATMGAPVLFRQKRPGRGERTFEIVKFRTMREATDAQGNPLSDAERLTAVGRWLRATSLDELPQLWNVVRGDLSLVGPRPLLVRYLPRYSPEQRRRHDVMPGITGWAQINGRNAIGWDEKFALDVWYVDHWSLALDARILLATIGRVLKRDGVSSDGHATMPEFEGTPRGT
jgi:lipopolysaccharide/colanic/teichoic acid biosynthesis glycosyltransferase